MSPSGLVGSAYYLVAFQPDSAVVALQRASTTTVTMGTYSVTIATVMVFTGGVTEVIICDVVESTPEQRENQLRSFVFQPPWEPSLVVQPVSLLRCAMPRTTLSTISSAVVLLGSSWGPEVSCCG